MAKIAEVQEVAIADLRPYERNAKTHSKEQVAKIAASIKEFGFVIKRWNGTRKNSEQRSSRASNYDIFTFSTEIIDFPCRKYRFHALTRSVPECIRAKKYQ